MLRRFFDTNIFVYAFDRDSAPKADVSLALLDTASEEFETVISNQVIHEFYNVAFRKFAIPMSVREARLFYQTVFQPLTIVPPSANAVLRAMELHKDLGFAWYDALIVAAAVESGCTELLTEDLQNGMWIDSLAVRNPILTT